MSDTQHLERIILVSKSATRNGNNVAWMCRCGQGTPLLGGGYGGKDKPVKCPKCELQYKVCFEEGKPIRVEEC